MNVSSDDLRAKGFWRGGTVYPDADTTLRVQIDRDAHGFIVYVMVANGEVIKVGQTKAFKERMNSTFGTLRRVMTTHAHHPRYQEQTFKKNGQDPIRNGHEIELWAQPFDSAADMEAVETAMNDHYRGICTKEGHRRAGRDRGK